MTVVTVGHWDGTRGGVLRLRLHVLTCATSKLLYRLAIDDNCRAVQVVGRVHADRRLLTFTTLYHHNTHAAPPTPHTKTTSLFTPLENVHYEWVQPSSGAVGIV